MKRDVNKECLLNLITLLSAPEGEVTVKQLISGMDYSNTDVKHALLKLQSEGRVTIHNPKNREYPNIFKEKKIRRVVNG